MTTALLVIDVQNDFCPGGLLAVPDGDAVVEPCNALMAKSSCVVLTQDWHPAGHHSFASHHDQAPFTMATLSYGEQVLWPDHCVQGSEGARFHADLQANRAQMVLRKGFRVNVDSYSAFQENDRVHKTGLAVWLKARGIHRVELCGLALDYCVQYSALDAIEAGFMVGVHEGAVRGIDPKGVEAAWQRMQQAGIERL